MSWLIEAYLNEEKLDAEDRNRMRASTFGLPEQRKYPLNDEQHVRSAIAYFNKCDQKDEAELAKNIKKAMKKFNMTANVSPENRFSKYYNLDEQTLEESSTLHKAMIGIKCSGDRKKIFKEDHGNKKLLAYIQKCKSIDDLEYIRKDTYVGIKQMEITRDNLKRIEKGADPKKGSIMQGTYDYFMKEFIKKDISSQDIQTTIDFTKNQILPAITARIKELKAQEKK